MSSATEIVHGHSSTTSPTGFPEGEHKDAIMSYTAHTQQSCDAVQGGANLPTSGAEDKRFTTAYGMVVWPTLPGLSSSSAAPVASAGTPTKHESTGLVHQHPSSAVAAAMAPRIHQALLPEMTVEQPNNIVGGEPSVGTVYVQQQAVSLQSK